MGHSKLIAIVRNACSGWAKTKIYDGRDLHFFFVASPNSQPNLFLKQKERDGIHLSNAAAKTLYADL